MPEGTWISLIDGSVVHGGRWMKQVHSFMSVPLYARENSAVVIRTVDNRPDYDYADHPVVHLYSVNQNLDILLCDGSGQQCATFQVQIDVDAITISSSEIHGFQVVHHRNDGMVAEGITEDGTLILHQK